MSKAAELAALIGSQSSLANRNMIRNGDMSVAQRGTSSTTLGAISTVDGWYVSTANLDNLAATITQDSTAPNGFNNSLKIDITTVESALAADELFWIQQRFEGQFLQRIGKGTSDAKAVTVSFWIRSGLTGTYILELYDADNTRQVSTSYTISSADTWEHKTITFPADTTGAFDDDIKHSLSLQWGLGAGSDFTSGTLSQTWTSVTNANRFVGQVNVMANTAYDVYITGVMFELGEVATPFEYISYGENLAQCQRYYQKWLADSTNDSIGSAAAWSDTTFIAEYHLQNTMRAAPGCTFDGTFVFSAVGNDRSASSLSLNRATKEQCQFAGTISDNNEQGTPGMFRAGSDADAYIEFDSTATTNSMLIPENEGYFDDSVWFGTKISIIRAGGTNARIRGILWGR